MKILIAEDDSSLRRALQAILQKNHYCVDAVEDGIQAFDYLKYGTYDLAILDIMMPKLDGLSVLSKIRQERNNIPILLLTAKSEIEDKVTGLDLGANDYLIKPFDVRELLARIRVLTRKSEVQQDSVLTFGNVSLNTINFEISAPKGSYKLSNKEYQTILLLMQNPKQTISVNQFLEKIWDLDSDAQENTVWTYISYLRSKLQVIGADVQISNRRNVGYFLEIIK